MLQPPSFNCQPLSPWQLPWSLTGGGYVDPLVKSKSDSFFFSHSFLSFFPSLLFRTLFKARFFNVRHICRTDVNESVSVPISFNTVRRHSMSVFSVVTVRLLKGCLLRSAPGKKKTASKKKKHWHWLRMEWRGRWRLYMLVSINKSGAAPCWYQLSMMSVLSNVK